MILFFFASQLIAMFKKTNLGTVFTIKIIDIIENQCNIKPENFKENLEKVFIEGNDKILKNLDIIVDNLEVVLRKENIDI